MGNVCYTRCSNTHHYELLEGKQNLVHYSNGRAGDGHSLQLTATGPNERVGAGVQPQDIDDLTDLLSKLGTRLSSDPNNPLDMIHVVDLLDLPEEREVFAPLEYKQHEE